MQKEKISSFQFFTMLFISRALTTLTYLSSYTKDIRLSDMLIQPIPRIAMGIIIMLPVYFLYKKHPDKSIFDRIREKSSVFAKVSVIVCSVIFLYFTVVTLARLDLFAGTVVFPETNVNYLIVFAVICCAYGAFLGWEALGRSAVLSAILVVPAIIFIVVNLVNKVDLLNLSPVFYNGVTPVLKTAVDSMGQTVEYAIIAIALPKVSGKKVKGYLIWLVAQTALMGILFFFAGAVMGNFASTQLFPFHTLASLAQFSMFDRLDAIFTSVWIFGAFIKVGLLIYLQADILCVEFPKISRGIFIVVIGSLTILLNLFVSGEIQRFSYIDSSKIKIVFTIIAAFLIPLIILVGKWGDKKCVKQ